MTLWVTAFSRAVALPPAGGASYIEVESGAVSRALEDLWSRCMTQPPRRKRLEVEDIGDITVVNFVDKKILDEQNIQIIGEQLFSLVDELGRKKILLNFSNVEFLSSAALGKLITLNRKLQ